MDEAARAAQAAKHSWTNGDAVFSRVSENHYLHAYFAQGVHAFRVKPVSRFAPRRSRVSDQGVPRRAEGTRDQWTRTYSVVGEAVAVGLSFRREPPVSVMRWA